MALQLTHTCLFHLSSSLTHVGFFSQNPQSTACTRACFAFPLNWAVSLSPTSCFIRRLVMTCCHTGGEIWEMRVLPSTFTFRAFIRIALRQFIHIFTRWWWWLPYKVPTGTPGAVWGSGSFPRTLQHAGQRNWTSDLPITRCWLYPWATDASLYMCLFW